MENVNLELVPLAHMLALQSDPVIIFFLGGGFDHNAYSYQFVISSFSALLHRRTDRHRDIHTYIHWKQHLLRWHTSNIVIVQWSAVRYSEGLLRGHNNEFYCRLVVANLYGILPKFTYKRVCKLFANLTRAVRPELDWRQMVAFPSSITVLWPVPVYTAWWMRNVCEQLAHHHYANVKWLWVGQPLNSESDTLKNQARLPGNTYLWNDLLHQVIH